MGGGGGGQWQGLARRMFAGYDYLENFHDNNDDQYSFRYSLNIGR